LARACVGIGSPTDGLGRNKAAVSHRLRNAPIRWLRKLRNGQGGQRRLPTVANPPPDIPTRTDRAPAQTPIPATTLRRTRSRVRRRGARLGSRRAWFPFHPAIVAPDRLLPRAGALLRPGSPSTVSVLPPYRARMRCHGLRWKLSGDATSYANLHEGPKTLRTAFDIEPSMIINVRGVDSVNHVVPPILGSVLRVRPGILGDASYRTYRPGGRRCAYLGPLRLSVTTRTV
jgi:hypothetical protein